MLRSGRPFAGRPALAVPGPLAILAAMRTGLIIPSLGASRLERCLEAVSRLEPAPEACVLVLSGGAVVAGGPPGLEIVRRRRRLGFAAAVNLGLAGSAGSCDAVALLNDDAAPAPGWLGALVEELEADPGLAAVQGTVTDAGGVRVDGRGIGFDDWGLPVQVDRGVDAAEDRGRAPRWAVSGTACLYRSQALAAAALADGSVLDRRFDSYHEDLDLGLRLRRLGWRAGWIGGAPVAHLGSVTGTSFAWRHPWWVLANRWRALAGNLSRGALLRAMPRLLRGELRAVRTLARRNPRTLPVAAAVGCALPMLVAASWRRETPGARLAALPGGAP